MEIWEQEAIRRVLAGDREEYRGLMERHLPAVLRMTLRVTGNLEDAEEAAQDAFLLAYKKISTFRGDAAFGTWVYRIAMNCSLNLIKRRARNIDWNAETLDGTPDSQQVSSNPTPEAALIIAEAKLQREHAMNALTPNERTAFVLRHLEEQPVDVIADTLGISCNSARQVVFRAITKLRRALGPPQANLRTKVLKSHLIKEAQ
jgi:RNA polymerase sigma-70 factor (ECF subfamily)